MTARLTRCHGCDDVRHVNKVGYCATCARLTSKKPRDLTRGERDYLRQRSDAARERVVEGCRTGAL